MGQQVNEALFEGVNKAGYFLKPKDTRKPLLKSSLRPCTRTRKFAFDIQIISAHQLPRPKKLNSPINPFVEVDIVGATSIEWNSDSRMKTTTRIHDNGFNPTWINEKFSGTLSAQNELVFIRLLINSHDEHDDETTTIGIFVSKLENLKKGYRYIPINDSLGEELIYSSLFVKIGYSEIS